MVILAAVAFVYSWEAILMSNQDKRGSFFYTLLGYLAILLILLAIALLIGAGLYWLVIIPKRFPSDDSLVKGIGFTLNTPGIFWWVIKESRPRWRNKVYWWTTTGLLFVHTVCFLVAFRYVQHWTLWYFLVISTLEVPVIMAVVDWTFEKFGKRHH
jgi:hypothetical protein